MMIELLEEGPHAGDKWLREQADGWQYRIYRYQNEPNDPSRGTHRIDVLDALGTTVIYSEEAHLTSDDHGRGWGEATFCDVLMAHKRLPQPGVYTNRDDAIAFEERMKKYRRE